MKFLAIAAAGVSVYMSAQATAIFTISDGVNPLISVSDNGPGDSSSAMGAIIVQTNVGVWDLTIDTGITKPAAGSATSPIMDINVLAQSTAGGTLTLTFSDNNFGPATGTINAGLTGFTVNGAIAQGGESVYGDQANVVGATTVPITSIAPIPLPSSSGSATSSGPLLLNAPFSLTEVVQISTEGSTLVNLDASFNFSPVPEPGIPALGALGIAGWVLFRLRNRRA